jgi:hypothetical protein
MLGNVSPEYYFGTAFWPNSAPLNGRALSGDSGGPCYDNYGNLIGIHITGDASISETGETDDLKLAAPEVMSFIQQNLFSPQSLRIQAAGTNVVVTWSGAGVLQRASPLIGSFSDLPNATSPYTNHVMDSFQEFFRLRPN